MQIIRNLFNPAARPGNGGQPGAANPGQRNAAGAEAPAGGLGMRRVAISFARLFTPFLRPFRARADAPPREAPPLAARRASVNDPHPRGAAEAAGVPPLDRARSDSVVRLPNGADEPLIPDD